VVPPVATDAECDEIFFDVIPQQTPELKVMNLKIPPGSTGNAIRPAPALFDAAFGRIPDRYAVGDVLMH
jgi:hypothetical protein